MTTSRYDLHTIDYSVQGWDSILATDMEKLDDIIPTRSIVTLGETVAAYDALYLKAADSKWYKAQADGTKQPSLGLACESGALDDEIRLHRVGEITNTSWAWATIGAPIYLDPTTAGALTQTRPASNIQLVGYALSATKMLVLISGDSDALTKDIFDATTFLYATSDDVPEAKTPAQVMEILSGTAAANFAMNAKRITKLANPVLAQDAVTKAYADATVSGLDLKASCRVATTAALPACTASGSKVGKTLTGNAVGILTIDEVNTVLDDRVLVKNQAAGADNGIYRVTTEGTASVAFVLTRTIDADEGVIVTEGMYALFIGEVTSGMYAFIEEGTVNKDKGWVLITDDPIILDTTPLVFSQFSSVGAPVTTFLELTDTPADYTGDALKVVRVNAGEAALEFVAFAAQMSAAEYTLTYAADVEINWNNGSTQYVVLTGNIIFTFVNPVNGQVYRIRITQDATGSRTATWPTIKWAGGSVPTLTTTVDKSDIITLLYSNGAYYADCVKNF